MGDLKQFEQRAPVKYRALYLKALQGKLAPRSAIKIKCLECVCWQRMEGGVDQIGGGEVRSCPLWAVRPFQEPSRRRQAAQPATSSVE